MRCSHPYIYREEERVSPGHTRVCACVCRLCVSVKVTRQQRRVGARDLPYHEGGRERYGGG